MQLFFAQIARLTFFASQDTKFVQNRTAHFKLCYRERLQYEMKSTIKKIILFLLNWKKMMGMKKNKAYYYEMKQKPLL